MKKWTEITAKWPASSARATSAPRPWHGAVSAKQAAYLRLLIARYGTAEERALNIDGLSKRTASLIIDHLLAVSRPVQPLQPTEPDAKGAPVRVGRFAKRATEMPNIFPDTYET